MIRKFNYIFLTAVLLVSTSTAFCQEGLRFSFSIKSTFWQAWWFYGLCLIAFLAGLYTIIKLRTRSLERQRLRLEKTMNERTAELEQQNLKLQTTLEQQEQAEKALRKNQERFHCLVDAGFEGIGIYHEGEILDANERLAEMFGYKIDDIIGKNTLDFVAGESMDLVLEKRGAETEEPYEYMALRRDGTVFPVEVQTKAIAYEGRMVKVAAIRDISGRNGAEQELKAPNNLLLAREKELSAANQQLSASIQSLQAHEETLKESEESFRALVENAPEALVVLDVEKGSFMQVTENACQLFKMTNEALLKVDPAELSPPTQPDGRPSSEAAMEVIGQAMNGEKPVFEWMHRDSEGKDIPCEVRLVLLPSAHRKLVRGSITDITARKEAEEKLKALNQELINNETQLSAANEQLSASIQQLQAQEGILRESERKYRSLFDQIADPIFIFDKKSKLFLDCNDAVLRIYGYSKDELMKMTSMNLHPRENHEYVKENFDKKNLDKTNPNIHLTKSGERIDVEILSDEIEYQGRPAWISIVRNVTERKRAEEIQRQNEKRFRDLFQNSPDAIFVEDLDGFVLDVNKAACKLHGLSQEELIGKNMLDLVPESDRGKVKQGWPDFVAGKITHVERYCVTRDGQRIPVELRATRMDYLNRPIILFHVRDISFRREAEESLKKLNQQLLNHQKELSAANQQLTASFEQLKANEIALIESEERIRLIIDSAQDAVITMDEKSLITEWNAKAEKIFGWSRKEVIRKNLADKILPEQFREAHAKGLERYFATGEGSVLSQRREIQALHRDGNEFQVELTITPLKVGNSTIFSGFIRDITQQKKAEKELKAAKESAESANHELRNTNQHLEQATLLAKEMAMQAEMASGAKSEFLANMSHEIRTPLNSIIGMTELTLETQLNSEQRGYLNVVQSSSEGLLSLINDILDFSKIEAGQMELEHIELNLREVVEGVAEMLGTRANAKGVEMLCYIDAEIPSWLVGDPTRLRQILINLTGNSIKFTEQGDVAIKVKFRKQNDNAVELHFKVSDTGIGISPENIKKIFEKFSQADTSTTRKFGGTGLGLNISKSLVEMMGGELWVESQEGKGSEFQFKIRLPIGQRTDDDFQQSYPDFKTTHVIVVDDNETNRFILRKMLENWEFQVTEAQSGSQALSILKNSKNPISLALLDQKMPEMDGLELAQKIREDEAFKDMKLIMLSSLVSYDRELIKKMGIAASILKPIKQKTLFNALLKVLTERRHDDSADQNNKISEQIEKTISGNILLVEDNPSNQKLAKKILVKRGYHVDIAENGRLAVEAFTRFRHDLILMDIYMPEMDGFEATHEIRTRESEYMEARIPIIALTAHAIEGYREKCFENNMDDFVTKPINKKILFETIEKWLDSRPTVLVVDDSIDNRNLVIHHLRKTGDYQLVTAKNGQEAVDIFRRRPVSLVLMDMEMPVMDGRTATRRIRAFKNGTDVPIIALTAHNDKKHLDQAFDAGCTSYLGKPLRKAKLLECLDKHLY